MKVTAKQWVDALASGKYKKGTGTLQMNGKYCCLGVLAEKLGVPDSVTSPYVPTGYDFGEEYGVATAGVPRTILSENVMKDLWDKNDGNKTFAEVISYIEKNFDADHEFEWGENVASN